VKMFSPLLPSIFWLRHFSNLNGAAAGLKYMAATPALHYSAVNRKVLGIGLLTAALLIVSHSSAFAQAAAGGDTLGGHAQTAATDLQNGGAYILDMMSYIFAVGAGIAAGYTFWQYHKNPNGQHKLGYAIGSLVVAGFFAALPSFINFSSQTVSGTNGAVSGQTALTYSGGG
jgi:hypothetical protein